MVSAHSVDCSLCSSFANFTELPSYIEVRLHLDNLERSSTWLDLHQTSHGGPLLVSLHSLTNPASHIAMAGKSPGGETQMLSRFHKSVLPALAALITAAVATPAHAVLERVGPTDNGPRGGGFPAWYRTPAGSASNSAVRLASPSSTAAGASFLPGTRSSRRSSPPPSSTSTSSSPATRR